MIAILLYASVNDYLSYQVSNRLILLGWLCSLYFSWQTAQFALWIWGTLAPVILLWPVFYIRGLGAGDIKLFSVIGSFYGVRLACRLIAVSMFMGAVLSIFHIALDGSLKKYFSYFYHLISNGLYTRKVPDVFLNGKNGSGTKIHFTYAISAAYFLHLLGQAIE